jgi:hypothetical protein
MVYTSGISVSAVAKACCNKSGASSENTGDGQAKMAAQLFQQLCKRDAEQESLEDLQESKLRIICRLQSCRFACTA